MIISLILEFEDQGTMPDLVSTVVSSLNLQTCLVGLVVIFAVYKLRQRMKYKLPPGPFALPLIGNYDRELFGSCIYRIN